MLPLKRISLFSHLTLMRQNFDPIWSKLLYVTTCSERLREVQLYMLEEGSVALRLVTWTLSEKVQGSAFVVGSLC